MSAKSILLTNIESTTDMRTLPPNGGSGGRPAPRYTRMFISLISKSTPLFPSTDPATKPAAEHGGMKIVKDASRAFWVLILNKIRETGR